MTPFVSENSRLYRKIQNLVKKIANLNLGHLFSDFVIYFHDLLLNLLVEPRLQFPGKGGILRSNVTPLAASATAIHGILNLANDVHPYRAVVLFS